MKIENIKFKAKRLDNREWVEGNLMKESYGARIIEHTSKADNWIAVDPSTVCQFTGLKDCERKEIWEGDIIEDDYKTEIVFDQGAFLIHSIANNGKETFHPLFNYIEWNGNITCKVIGNKFDKNK